MVPESVPRVTTPSMARRLCPALVILSVVLAGCGASSGGIEGVGNTTPLQELKTEASGTSLPLENATATEPASEGAVQIAANGPFDYCIAYPEGFKRLTIEAQVEIVGPNSGSGPEPGLVWIDAVDAQGHTALDAANGEAGSVGGLHPRSTTMLGGEEALVLDGVPGQDAIRKVYIVHGGLLYALNFSPCRSDNNTANAHLETRFTSVTSSWVWM